MANYWREREDAAREAEVTELQLESGRRASAVGGGRAVRSSPATVEVYRMVDGDWPAG